MTKHQQLHNAIETYFQTLHQCDVTLFDRVFHPESSLFDGDEGRVNTETCREFRAAVAKRASPASAGLAPENDILLVDWLSDTSAVAKLRIRIHANVFVDYLNFVFDGEKFMIVSKIWHLEKQIPAAAA